MLLDHLGMIGSGNGWRWPTSASSLVCIPDNLARLLVRLVYVPTYVPRAWKTTLTVGVALQYCELGAGTCLQCLIVLDYTI